MTNKEVAISWNHGVTSREYYRILNGKFKPGEQPREYAEEEFYKSLKKYCEANQHEIKRREEQIKKRRKRSKK